MVLVTGIRGSARTAYHPAFLSCTQRRTRSPLAGPTVAVTWSTTWRNRWPSANTRKPCGLTYKMDSYPLLVTSGESWYIPYISTRETRTANRERLPRVHASTVPADQRRAAPHPMPRGAPGSLMIEDTPTAAVRTVRLRGLGCCVGLYRLTRA